ncbi:MAG: hypothetical protein MR945_09140 [Agathobacter sp.]|nr:hypothetical protein [Agathobacter sp.]
MEQNQVEKMMDKILDDNEATSKKLTEKEILEQNDSNDSLVDEVPRGIHPLKRAITFDGNCMEEIAYDLDQLTPIQYLNLVKRLSKKRQIAVPEVDMEVQISYFALSTGIPVTILKSQLTASDYAQICGLVRTFLLGASAEELEED